MVSPKDPSARPKAGHEPQSEAEEVRRTPSHGASRSAVERKGFVSIRPASLRARPETFSLDLKCRSSVAVVLTGFGENAISSFSRVLRLLRSS